MCNSELNEHEQKKLDHYFVQSNLMQQYGWFSRPKSVIVMIESDDDICAVVSIQNFSVSLFFLLPDCDRRMVMIFECIFLWPVLQPKRLVVFM